MLINKEKIDAVYAKLMIANDGIADDNPFADVASTTANPTLAGIALMSQYEQMMYSRTPNSPLERTSPLPALATPTLPSHLHHLAKQILTNNIDEIEIKVRVLDLIYERGYTVPPTVWLPTGNMATAFDDANGQGFEGELPSEYLAWCAWVNGEQMSTDNELTDDTWDEFFPAQRLKLLKNLRQHNPKFALELIAKFAPNEPAEKRLAIINTLAVNLSADDKDFLKSLNKDRSQKVKELAKRLLMRLGDYELNDSLADELFDELQRLDNGICFKSTKNNKKSQDNFEKLQKVNIIALAKKFDLSLKEFVLAWDWHMGQNYHHYYDVNMVFLWQAVTILSDDELAQVSEQLIKALLKIDDFYDYWQIIRARLPIKIRQDVAEKQFIKGIDFGELLGISPKPLDKSFKVLQDSTSFKNLIKDIKRHQEKYGAYLEGYLVHQIQALGLLVHQDTAKEMIIALETMGVMRTDPALQILTLNALLDKRA